MLVAKEKIAKYEVRVGDINYGGHMGNDKSLLLFHDARIKFLESLDFSEKNIGDETGTIMSEAHIYFKKEVFLHDLLFIDVSISEVTTSSMIINYLVHRENDAVVVLKGSTKIIAFDYDKKRVKRIPEVFIKKIKPD